MEWKKLTFWKQSETNKGHTTVTFTGILICTQFSDSQDIFSGCYVAILNGLIASTNDDQALKVIADKGD